MYPHLPFELNNIFFLFLQAQGFHIDYLSKVPLVKDTVHKQSLLYHACQNVMENYPDSTDLFSELGSVSRCAKVRIQAYIQVCLGSFLVRAV